MPPLAKCPTSTPPKGTEVERVEMQLWLNGFSVVWLMRLSWFFAAFLAFVAFRELLVDGLVFFFVYLCNSERHPESKHSIQ